MPVYSLSTSLKRPFLISLARYCCCLAGNVLWPLLKHFINRTVNFRSLIHLKILPLATRAMAVVYNSAVGSQNCLGIMLIIYGHPSAADHDDDVAGLKLLTNKAGKNYKKLLNGQTSKAYLDMDTHVHVCLKVLTRVTWEKFHTKSLKLFFHAWFCVALKPFNWFSSSFSRWLLNWFIARPNRPFYGSIYAHLITKWLSKLQIYADLIYSCPSCAAAIRKL